MKPTPETDAATLTGFSNVKFVWPDFARRLERERDEAREQVAAMESWGKLVDAKTSVLFLSKSKQLEQALWERDEARRPLEQAQFDNDVFRQIMKALDGRFGCGHSGNSSEDCWAHVKHVDEVIAERDKLQAELAELKRVWFDAREIIATEFENKYRADRDKLRAALVRLDENSDLLGCQTGGEFSDCTCDGCFAREALKATK